MTEQTWPTAPIIKAACRAENGDLLDAGIWHRQPDGWYTADVNETPWEPYELDYPFTIIWLPKEQA